MRRTVTYRNFEWDREKAWKNLAKHRITFEEAVTVFDDPFFFAYKDLKHSVVSYFHFSVSQWILCASVVKFLLRQFHHRDTEDAQRPREQLKSGHYRI